MITAESVGSVPDEPVRSTPSSPIATGGDSDARRMLRSATILTGVIAAFGLLARLRVLYSGYARPSSGNIFFRLYALLELPHLVVLGLFAVATGVLVAFTPKADRPSADGARRLPAPSMRSLAVLGALVLIAGIATTHFILHHSLLSMDEFAADFQAKIFSRGAYAPVIPWPWRSIGPAITPIFVGFDEATGRWVSQYLPVYSLLKAPFLAAGMESLLNPLLTAASIVMLGIVARRLWPGEGARPWIAIALLASSTQLIVTAGTGYSMPAHLLLNLVWLWLYLRDDARSWVAALLVGVLALGLHNPFPHALFVAPFLLRLVRDRRWARAASAAITYGVSGAGWLLWLRFVSPLARGAQGGILQLFQFPDAGTLALHTMNVSLLFTWHAPVLGILVLVAVSHPRRLEKPLGDLAMGVALTLGFYMFFASTQGHGWGYRYAFQVLSSLSLLAAAGVPTVESVFGATRTRQWLTAGLCIGVLVQLPLRLRDTERFVRPFAEGQAYVRSRDATVVILHGDALWYGRDLLRNDPFLDRPIVVKAGALGPGSVQAIKRSYPGKVLDLDDRELLKLGMTPWAHHEQ